MKIKGLNRNQEPVEVTIEGNLITDVIKLDSSEGIDQYIIPGFIDIHTHGGYGTDFVDCDEQSTRKYLRALPSEGTTSIVHASITTEYNNLLDSITVAKEVMNNPHPDEVRYLGVNIEGNFLNKAKKGAHKEELLVPITNEHVEDLSREGVVRMISAAYENSTLDVIENIKSKHIIPSLAHSIATGIETEQFVNAGLKGITHMFNAMPAFLHREDNSINRAMTMDELYTEIIVDGIHAHPEIVKLLYKVKPLNKILVITDSAPVKGLPDGDYMFGELEIVKTGNTIHTKIDGSLAGSIANMHMCFTNMIKFTGCTLEEASIMTSTNQAEYLGIENLGKIEKNFLADILILDKELNIKETIANGKTLFKRGKDMIKFIVGKKEELEEIVANRMEEIIKAEDKPKFILATGNSPIGVYRKLIYKHKDDGLSFRDLITYNLDEYRDIDKFPNDSFRKFMDDNLFNHIDIYKQKTYFPREPKLYNQLLDKFSKFDFTILGVGTNGHIAFNEPGTPFKTRTHEVKLEQSTIDSNFPGRTEYPTKAITMGLFDIYNKSKEIILLAWGESKREALNKLKEGIKTDDCPITHFIDHPNITIVTDLKEFE